MSKRSGVAVPATSKKPYVPLWKKMGRKVDEEIARGTAARRKKAKKKISGVVGR